MTQQIASPLVQAADGLEAAERQIEGALKVNIPDVAALLRTIALSLPGTSPSGPPSTPPKAPPSGPPSTPPKAPPSTGTGLIAVGSPSVS